MDTDPDSCEGCAAWLIDSRSFDGLLVLKDSVPFRWIEIPYTLKVRADTVDIWEHTSPPSYMGRNKFFPDRLSIRLSETNFATMQDFLDSTFCNALKFSGPPDTTALFVASDSLNHAPIFRGDSLTIVGRNLATVTFDSLLHKFIVDVESVPGGSGIDTVKMTQPGAGFTISGSPGVAPVASFIFALANDLGAVEGLSGSGFAVRTGTDTWSVRTLQEGAGISITNPAGVLGDPTITNTGDLSTTNEVQTYSHAGGTNIYTNTLSLGGGTWSIAGGGIAVVSSSGGAITVTATQKANNGLSDNEDGGVVRLGNTFMNLSDGLFGTDRKVNTNGKMLFVGDNTDSTLFVVDGTNDRVGVGRLPVQRLDISGASGTYTRVNTTGGVAVSGYIINNSADANASWAILRNAGGDFQIGSSDGEWPSGTLTTPFVIIPNPPDNSFYMDAAGFIAFGGNAATRRFDNYGETRLRDLNTTSPTLLVGSDANGVLSAVTLGAGISFTGSTLDVSAGSKYQLFRDDNVDKTARAAANFVSSVRVIATLTDDAVNNETEVSFDLGINTVANSYLSTRAAASVMGRSAATGGDVADIASTADGQVLRRNGTILDWGQVTTLGITNSAVTYAKIQNVTATNRFLGRITAGAGVVQELTAANARTIMEMTPSINRFALWTTATALGSDAAFTFDAANDRATFTGTVAGVGAGTGILNLTAGTIAASTTFLRMSGNITNNVIAELLNTNNVAATANSIYTISSGGGAAGDPILQFNVAGAATHSIGVDNSDADKFKITPNSGTPGGVGDASLVATTAAIPLWGINKDAPAYMLDIGGQCRAVQFMVTNVEPTFGAAGNGLGTGGVINDITGGDNAFTIRFTTGSAGLVAGGAICTITYNTAWPTFAVPAFSQVDDDAGNEISKFVLGSMTGGSFELKVRTGQTLTPSTEYILSFVVGGQG